MSRLFLLQSSWPEGSIVDINTTNKSFIKYATALRKMGISNWYFCLALSQPELVGVDPYDPNLSMELKIRVAQERAINPWYYFREIAMVPQDGADPVRFRLNRGTATMLWCFFMNIDIGFLMIRQQGKTVALINLICYLMQVLKGSRTLLLTRGSDLRAETIAACKATRKLLPAYLWVHSRTDADNTEAFTYDHRSNRLLTCIAQNNRDSAVNAGRGITTGRLLADEIAYTKFIRKMLPAALAAGTTARRIAEEEGVPYGNIFTTTPGKRDEKDGKYVFDLFHDGYFWNELLLDSDSREAIIAIIRNNCKGDRVLIHAPFTHRQLGMTDRELYEAAANAGGTREEQLRDFGLRWTAGSLQSPLSQEEADTISNSVIDPLSTEIGANNYVLQWYYKETKIADKLKTMHILGVDTSDAVGRDNISLVLTNSETLETAAVGIVNESNLILFANWLADLLIKYPTIILVIERKSSAPTIIDAVTLRLVAEGINPYRRIFNNIIQSRDEHDTDYQELARAGSGKSDGFYQLYRKHLGFITTGTKRKLLYSEVLQNAVRMAGTLVRDKMLASELLSLVVRDGRIDHKSSGNDDCVISWLLTIWFMLHGNRLQFYGVSNRLLLRRQQAITDNASVNSEFDVEEYEAEIEAEANLKTDISELCSKLQTCSNPYLKKNMERQLRVMLADLKLDTSQAVSLTELQELLKNDKLNARYL